MAEAEKKLVRAVNMMASTLDLRHFVMPCTFTKILLRNPLDGFTPDMYHLAQNFLGKCQIGLAHQQAIRELFSEADVNVLAVAAH